MQEIASSPDLGTDDAVAFVAQLIRLRREVSETGHQLDRIEAEFREALKERARERFEEYR